MMAAFLGSECRGVVTVPASGTAQLTIHGRSAGESYTLKYYDEVSKKLYNIPNAVKM
jgi:hypothetical protein